MKQLTTKLAMDGETKFTVYGIENKRKELV